MLNEMAVGDDALFTRVCREHGWKRTAQRRAVFNCLCGNRDHPSVEAVWQLVRKHLHDVSLDSVYRILDDFASAGIILRLEGSRVIRYDSATKPHGHYLCVDCGRITDFEFDACGDAAGRCREFGAVTGVEVFVRGVCDDCQSRPPPREAR